MGPNEETSVQSAQTKRNLMERVAYWGPAIAVSLAMFIAVIDSTLMNVAIPAIVVDLETTVATIQGAISFYAMVMGALILPGGVLALRYGIRRLMTVTLIVYGFGTLLAAVSWNVTVLYFGWSVVEGAAAAVLLPLTFTVLVVSYEGKERAKALGMLAGVNAAGAAFGPIFGGALTTYASWRWGFALEAVVVVITLAFVRYLPEERLQESPERFDMGGTVLSIVGATLVVAGVLLAGRYGWLLARRPFSVGSVQLQLFGVSPTVWLVGLGLLTFVVFVQYELRVAQSGGSPLVPMQVFDDSQFTAGVVTNAIRSLVLAGFMFIMPVFLQSGVGYTAFEAGIALLPFSMATFLLSVFTTGWREYVSQKTLIQTGIVFMGIGIVALVSTTRIDVTITQLIIPMTLVGLGLGLVMGQLIDMTLESVDRSMTTAASGVLNATAMLGYSFGSAILGAFMLRQYYGGVVDGVVATTGSQISSEGRETLIVAIEDAAETATKETQQELLNQLTPEQQDVLMSVFDSAIVEAQQATLVLLALFVLLVLLSSTLLPKANKDQNIPAEDYETTSSLDVESVDVAGRD